MPSASKDEIIDLTDIVEEGHPETPNLKTAKPSASADETLDDLDLEREIDQIFADLDPPGQDDQGGASDKKGGADSDTLDLDGLFDVQDGNASEASARAEGPGTGDGISKQYSTSKPTRNRAPSGSRTRPPRPRRNRRENRTGWRNLEVWDLTRPPPRRRMLRQTLQVTSLRISRIARPLTPK